MILETQCKDVKRWRKTSFDSVRFEEEGAVACLTRFLQLADLGKMTRNGAEGAEGAAYKRTSYASRLASCALATPAAITASFRNAPSAPLQHALLIRAWKCPTCLSTVTSALACGTWHLKLVNYREGSSGLLVGRLVGRKRQELAGLVETRSIMIGAVD